MYMSINDDDIWTYSIKLLFSYSVLVLAMHIYSEKQSKDIENSFVFYTFIYI